MEQRHTFETSYDHHSHWAPVDRYQPCFRACFGWNGDGLPGSRYRAGSTVSSRSSLFIPISSRSRGSSRCSSTKWIGDAIEDAISITTRGEDAPIAQALELVGGSVPGILLFTGKCSGGRGATLNALELFASEDDSSGEGLDGATYNIADDAADHRRRAPLAQP